MRSWAFLLVGALALAPSHPSVVPPVRTRAAPTTIEAAGRLEQRSVPTAAPSVKVVGNHLVDAKGRIVRLLGVDRSGTQYACSEGWGIFDGPSDQASVTSMTAWNISAVRVDLNEDCWLGINGVDARYAGSNYIEAITRYVDLLNANGLVVIIDLHRAAPGNYKATTEGPMADRDHAPRFWASVASTFKDDHSILFDLYNEPYPDSNRDSTAAWRCVRDGGSCPGVTWKGHPYTAAGSQELLDAIRQAGATNPAMIGGPQYAGDVDRWLEFQPKDPLHQLVVSIHIYGPDWAPCGRKSCWNSDIAPLAERVPIVEGEIGDIDCDHDFIDPLMRWNDEHGVSYIGWSWITGDCAAEPALITSYKGDPTRYGVGLRDHLLGQGS